jgi:N-acetylmuramoyl-L-alanine amidase
MYRLITFAFLLLFGVQVQANHLKQLRTNAQGLDLVLTNACTPKIFRLNQPYRIVIDLPNTQLGPGLNFRSHGAIRLAQFSPTVVRVVLESETLPNYHLDTHWQADGYHLGFKISQATASQRPISYATPRPSRPGYRKVVVVIDPGHGGKDPGAMGYHRTREKQVVLAIAKRLQQKINRQPGMMAVLTRDGDYFIDLRRRLDISRRYHPDLFVAIHADAFTNTASHGASVFALSQRGATSEAARWLAEKENYSELAGVNLRNLDDKNGMIRSVLIDLSQTATIQASIKIGTRVLGHLGHITSLHNRSVEQARFVVLKSPDTPSILVETGFISNPNEERNLASSAYQEQLSQAIFSGIYQYFKEYPPRGSKL